MTLPAHIETALHQSLHDGRFRADGLPGGELSVEEGLDAGG
jgi:hypothetical protein